MSEPLPADRPDGAMSAAFRPLTLGVVAIVTCVAFEAMAVTTAMPVIGDDLGAGAGYGLAFSMFLTASLLGSVLAGSRCDAEGPRRSLITGMALLVAGLVLSAAAGEFWLVTAGRAVSGLGSGAMVVALYVIIGQVYPSRIQPVIFGWVATAWILPSMVGPLAAGLLAQYVSWRWVFAVAIPIVAVAAALVWPRVRHLGAPENPELDPALGRRRAVWGIFLACGVFAAQWAGNEAAAAGSVTLGVLAAAGVLAAVAALAVLLPRGALRLRRGLPSVVATRGLINAAFVSAEAFMPVMLLAVYGVSPATAGIALTAGAVGWAIGSFLQARVPGPRRWLLLAGGSGLLTLSIGGTGLLAGAQAPFWLLVAVWSLAGVAMGAALSSTSVLVLDASSAADRGQNSASLQLSDQVGAVAGTTVGGVLLAVLVQQDPVGPEAGYALMWLVLAVFAVIGTAAGIRSASVRPSTGKVHSQA
ncbi:MAG: MFS transporter [Arthrobacter sp.]